MRTLLLPADRHSSLRIAHRCGLLGSALLLALLATEASAATSRWSASNNRIYIEGGGAMTLTDIRASTLNLPDTALQRVGAPGDKVWLLTANIYVRDGSMLKLHGDAAGGDVNQLRILSQPSTAPATDFTNVLQITAEHGEIDLDGTRVTSWDPAAGGPDTNPADGRSFMRARSSDATGVDIESRMDVVRSEVSYLGYNASEAYGLSWKANGNLATLDVFGDVIDSDIHHNYFGVYSFGLQDGQWTGNKIRDNIGYGLDAHDDSDNLVIDNNQVVNNGVGQDKANHGIILSERCDNARITNNVASGNGGNGIMMHDLSDGGLIEGNTASNNGDAGVAIFCSRNTTVRNNILDANLYGVRLSVASFDNTIENNQVTNSGAFGIYVYRGNDTNGICGSELVPHDNTFRGNTVSGSATNGVKVSEGYNLQFVNNTLNDGVSIKNAVSPETWVVGFTGNTFGEGVVVALDGAPATPIRAEFSDTDHVSLELDTGAVARFASSTGEVFDLLRDLYVDVTGSNSRLDLTPANAGAAFEVDTRPLQVATDGSLVQVSPTQWETSGSRAKAWIARAAAPASSVGYTVGDLAPGAAYDVKRGTTLVGTFAANDAGAISFSDVPGSDATQTYTVTPSATQPQAGGGEGGGGGGALGGAVLAGLLLGLLRRRARLPA